MLMAGMVAMASMGEPMPEFRQENMPTGKGHVCGSDQVKGCKKAQPRNSSCQCGSGIKAKKCCK
jgi:hypothetical protein